MKQCHPGSSCNYPCSVWHCVANAQGCAGSTPCRQNVNVGVIGVCSLVSNKCLVPSEWLPWNVRNTAFSYAAANFCTAQEDSSSVTQAWVLWQEVCMLAPWCAKQSKQPVQPSTSCCDQGADPEAMLISLAARYGNPQPAMDVLCSRGHPPQCDCHVSCFLSCSQGMTARWVCNFEAHGRPLGMQG